MTAEASDGYYWRVHFKMTDGDGNTLITTDQSSPIVCRDDLGATSFILSHDLYHYFGEPGAMIKYGNGFGYQIPHLKLTDASKEQFKFFYKVDGLLMKWEAFVPAFFSDAGADDYKDLTCRSTFGWKPHAALGDSGIGIIHMGTRRYMVSRKNAAEKVAQYLWKE
jgi:hypothetical protein